VETIGSKRSYALIWCMPNNDDDDVCSNFETVLPFTVYDIKFVKKFMTSQRVDLYI